MAEIRINAKAIRGNIEKLSSYLNKNNIKWSLIVKIMGGHRASLESILDKSILQNVHSVGDSRISGLKTIKSIDPDLVTMYIKPPAMNQVENVAKYADISLNSTFQTIEALNDASKKLRKKHKIIIMVEMGELREGVMRDEIISFYKKVFKFPYIEIIGIGTNLGCMYGIQPTYDKLIQLRMLKELIEVKFNKKIPLVSGGSSITLPLISKKMIPKGCNHLRIGEAAFMGTSPFDGKKFRDLSDNTFEFRAYIIELIKKWNTPDGIVSEANVGHTGKTEHEKMEQVYKAIMDFGMLDADVKNIKPKKSDVVFVGTSSDMTVYSLGHDSLGYSVGDTVKFKPDYTGVARLMTSKFISKKV